MGKFKLVSQFKPTGDQPDAIEKLERGIKAGHEFQTLLGVTGSGKSVAGDTNVLIKRGGNMTMANIGELIDKLFKLFPEKSRYFSDTEIIFCDGLPIKEKFEAYSFDPKTKQSSWRPVTQITRHKSPEKLFKIRTACGRELTATGDHNFYALRDGELKLLPTSNLKAKDYIPLPLKLNEPETPFHSLYLPNCFDGTQKLYISLPNFKLIWERYEYQLRPLLTAPKIHNLLHYGERVPFPTYKKLVTIAPALKQAATIGVYGKNYQSPLALKMTSGILRLLGYYIAEGHADLKYFTISSADVEIVSDFSETLHALGLKLARRKSTCDYQISSKFWSCLLGRLCGQNSYKKCLPGFWAQLSNSQLAELLKAYFSADGGVNGDDVTCISVSKTLASDIMYALMRFGIIARSRKRAMKIPNTDKRNTCWEIHISGQKFLKIFQKEIGFTLDRKNKKLNEIIKSNYNTNVDLIPLTSWFKNIREALSISQQRIAKECGFNRSFLSMIEKGTRLPSRLIAEKIFNFLEKVSLEKKTEVMEEIKTKKMLLNLYWTPIKDIELIEGEKYVYDFAVQENETFLSGFGGMFVHNTFTMANVIEKFQRPTLIISHNKTLTAQLASEFQEFFPDNAVHYFVSYYDYYQPEAYIPRSDTYIEKETQINEEIDRLRNAATMALLSRKDVIIVASVSCIYGLGNPSDYLELSIELKVSESYKRDKLLHRLIDLQYMRNDIDLRRGTFRVRGDVVEVVPADSDQVLRLDFFGDELEKITQFDALTGEGETKHGEYRLFPAKHFLTTSDKLERAMENIRLELAERLKILKGQDKLLEAQRLEQRTNFDLEMMAQAGYVNGIENYSRHLDGRPPGEAPSTLMDYFPDDFLLFIDESHITVPQVRAMYEGDRSRKLTLIDYGFRLPSALDNRPLKFAEFLKKVNQGIFVSATPTPYEIGKSAAVAEQLVRPTGLLDPEISVRPTKHQIDDLLDEIQKRVKKQQRVLLTTLTKKMAEELAEYLIESGVKARYLHSEVDTFERLEILRDLRLGIYDVIVGINLLREGLDLPEVSLVAILDADKEGYLRSETALLQVMGRAARHAEGKVIMYADRITGSMERAIAEVERRRKIQKDYNKEHNITPLTIVKAIRESRLAGAKIVPAEAGSQADISKMDKKQIRYYLDELRDRMDLASKNLEFEKAALLRDQIVEINKKLRRSRHGL